WRPRERRPCVVGVGSSSAAFPAVASESAREKELPSDAENSPSAVASAVGVAEYPSEIVLYRVRVGSTARDAVAVALAVPDIVVDTAVSSADSGVIPALRCRVRPPSTDPENVLVRSNSPVALSEMRGVRVKSPPRVTGPGAGEGVLRAR